MPRSLRRDREAVLESYRLADKTVPCQVGEFGPLRLGKRARRVHGDLERRVAADERRAVLTGEPRVLDVVVEILFEPDTLDAANVEKLFQVGRRRRVIVARDVKLQLLRQA